MSSFDKYNQTYVSYDTKEKNSTIGHDEILKKMKQEQEQEQEMYDDNANNANANANNADANNADADAEAEANANAEATTSKRRISFSNNSDDDVRVVVSSSSSRNISNKSADDNQSILSEGTVINFKETISNEFRISKEDNENELEDIAMEEMATKGMLLNQLNSFHERERLPLSEDVYAFIVACPVRSAPFWFAAYFIIVKYIIYGILLSDISNDEEYENGQYMVQVVKFFLIPVAVTMQDDLMTVYANIANKKYDATVMKPSKYATQTKFIIANTARLLDGLLSLGVNFGVMLMTNTILGVFLNFAALHFLQYIDNIFYELVDKGFFGDSMEYATTLCKQISFPRR
jgi:hypothetical protein